MIWFVVIDAAGEILRIGQCHLQDIQLQGETVLTFTADPAVSDVTHRWDGEQFLINALSAASVTALGAAGVNAQGDLI